MRIHIHWLPPLDLYDGSADNLIYDCAWAELPETPGVYVFARCFGESVAPLYVGQALNLRIRVRKQLNNAKLMVGIRNARNGPRVVLPAEVSTHYSKNIKRALDLVERSLLEHYLSEGFKLLNVQGTKVDTDVLDFGGNGRGRQTCPQRIAVPRRT
jgi:hypothetical protein